MASLRKQKKTWFACFTLADGKRTQRSTGIKDLGTPQIRADNMRLALVVAQEYEEAARGNRTEAQLRKSMGDLFNRVNGKRIEFAKTDLFLREWLVQVKVRKSEGTLISPGLVGLYTGGRSGLSNKFEQLIVRAGIKNDPISNGRGKGRAFREYGFHSFRHTFKSILVNAGVEVETVDVLIGHAKKTVSETYIHRSTDLLRKAIEKLPTF